MGERRPGGGLDVCRPTSDVVVERASAGATARHEACAPMARDTGPGFPWPRTTGAAVAALRSMCRRLSELIAAVGTSLILGACGGVTPHAPLSNHAEQRPRPVCTKDDSAALAQRLGSRWGSEHDLEIRCVGGRFPERGLFVEARWGSVRRVGIVSVDRRREIVPFIEMVADRTALPVMKKLLVADIDGDGIDEVVDAWRRAHQGASGDQLVVWATEGLQLEQIDGPQLNAYRAGLGSCRARAEVSEGGVAVIVQTAHGLPPVDCLRSGLHRFVMVDGRMVRLERRGDGAREPTPAPGTSTVPSFIDRSGS